jgi:hypothetical protein
MVLITGEVLCTSRRAEPESFACGQKMGCSSVARTLAPPRRMSAFHWTLEHLVIRNTPLRDPDRGSGRVCCVLQTELSLPCGRVNRQQLQGDKRLPPPSGATEGCVTFQKPVSEKHPIYLARDAIKLALLGVGMGTCDGPRPQPPLISFFSFTKCHQSISYCFVVFRFLTSRTTWSFSQAASGRPPVSGGDDFFCFPFLCFASFRFG